MKEFIEMEVKGIILDPHTGSPVVLLKDIDGKMIVPIWIGILEASAIASELERVSLARPMTHDLIKNIIGGLGAEVTRVEVYDLRENTFYGNICLKMGRKELAVDSRPSDAIALALRTNAPIFVNERVIELSRTIDLAQDEKEKWKEVLEKWRPEDFGKYKM